MEKVVVSNVERNLTLPDLSTNQNQDEYILSSIFPEEVWRIILVEKVGASPKKGADNLTNCFMASSYFRNVLARQRKFFLFPKVLEILAIWLENQEKKLDDKNNKPTSSESDDDNGDFLSDSELSELLVCREVCHQWKNHFDKFYQNSNRYTTVHHEEISRNLCETVINYESCEEEEEEEDDVRVLEPLLFIDHFAKTHGEPSKKGNPFPARALSFGHVPHAQRELMHNAFCHGISQLLSIYGEYLWHCDMLLRKPYFINRMALYYKLKAWLLSMPNLKSLKINCYGTEFEVQEEDISSELVVEMQRDISRDPLPEFKNLQFLEALNLEPVIFNEIIRKSGDGISELSIRQKNLADNAGDYDIYSEAHPLLQLKKLSVFFHSVKHFEQMENSAVATNWKLEVFHFFYDKEAKFVEWSRVFNMISSKWAGTITNLTLKMPVYESDEEKELGLKVTLCKTALKLPFLKRVALYIGNPCSIDFILASANTLESMEIYVVYDTDKEKDKGYYQMLKKRQCVKFLGFEKRGKQFAKKILKKFPHLTFLKKVAFCYQGEPDEGLITKLSLSFTKADLIKIKAGQ